MEQVNLSSSPETGSGNEFAGMDELNQFDLTNVNTDRPMLSGVVLVRCTGLVVKPGKPKDGEAPYNNLQIELVTVNPEKDVKTGKPINPGFKHTETITLKKTEKYSPQENLARLQECFVGEKGKWDASKIIGAEGTGRFSVQPAEGEFGERNRCSFVKKKVGVQVAA